ncbi:YkgJ family cysteine cluster protein [Allorhizobium terrae]|uniref:YkgJ family cysteine cluster protein n=1 Tax=Allorhizobium terrae TaxID=1848972 RepID=UPI001E44E827|nr:hypothetical protein [Allorhizobium terrae]
MTSHAPSEKADPLTAHSQSSSNTRTCGTCTLCCRLPDIDELSKPANAWCTHCVDGMGCQIYQNRPQTCRDFLCLWMTDATLGDEWEPAKAHMMVYTQGPQMTVLVDPAYPAMWKLEPYSTQLHDWAKEAEGRGGYVIVFVGDDVFKV